MKLTKAAFFALLSSAALVPAQASLVAYFTFDGDDATDSSGNGNNGTPGAGTTFSGDVPAAIGSGSSAAGNGAGSGVITVANTPSLETISNQLTIAMWVKADAGSNSNWVRLARKANEANDTNYGWIVNRFNNNSDTLIRIDAAGGFNQNRGGGSGGAAGNVLDGNWHHLAYTLDNGNWEEWVNGSMTGSGTYTHGSGFSNSEPLYILGRAGQSINGALDDVSVWSNRLSAAEIGLLANGTSALLIPEPSSAMLLLLGAVPLLRRRR